MPADRRLWRAVERGVSRRRSRRRRAPASASLGVGGADAAGLRDDVLACPRCSARLRLIAAVEDPGLVGKILAHVALAERPGPAPPPPREAGAPADSG